MRRRAVRGKRIGGGVSAELHDVRVLLWLMAGSEDVVQLVAKALDRAALPSDDWRRLIDIAIGAKGDCARVIATLNTWGWGYHEYVTAAMLPWEHVILAPDEIEALIDRINAGRYGDDSEPNNLYTATNAEVGQPGDRRPRRARKLPARLSYACAVAGVRTEEGR